MSSKNILNHFNIFKTEFKQHSLFIRNNITKLGIDIFELYASKTISFCVFNVGFNYVAMLGSFGVQLCIQVFSIPSN